jgi:pimeloyl-ACP methyl ester carboxylesterase
MQPVHFKNSIGETLSGTLHRPADATGYGFVLGHCFTCSQHTRILIDLSNTLTGLGISVLRFDFSGNGKSEGLFEKSTYTKQVEEMGVAVDFMKKNGADQVLIGGHSMGGMVSIFTAAKRNDIMGVIVLAVGASPLHPERLLTDIQKNRLFDNGNVVFSSRGRDLVLAQDFFDDADAYDVREMISRITCPALVVLAADDTVTDPIPAKSIFSSANENVDLFEVNGADHMFGLAEHRQVVMARVTQWIKNNYLS